MLGSPLAQCALLHILQAEFLLGAMLTTLLLSALGCGIGLVVGFGLAVVRRMRGAASAPLRVVAILFVELFRRIPFLVMLFFMFYATQFAGFDASLFSIATISVCMIATAFSRRSFAPAWIPCTRTSGTALRSPTSR